MFMVATDRENLFKSEKRLRLSNQCFYFEVFENATTWFLFRKVVQLETLNKQVHFFASSRLTFSV